VANGGLRGYNSFGEMNLAEIIEELPKLTAEERQAIYRQIEELDGEPQFEATEEMRAAIDEATRSLEAGKGIPLEEVRQRFLAKWATK
jgi:DNA-binding transcriptional MerR regulator